MVLFVVESPSKIKTLGRFIRNYFPEEKIYLVATLGHIKDLPSKNLGVDLNNFSPHLVFLRGKKKLLQKICEIIEKYRIKKIYLATDPDREGEAIACHLEKEIKKSVKNSQKNLEFYRIDLLEITKTGLSKALSQIRKVDPNLYESWKGRRVSDRLVGYLVSPLLSSAFKKRLSAGRVQSIALRLIVEREREILNFKSETFYSLKVFLKSDNFSLETEFFINKKLVKEKNSENLLSKFKKVFPENEVVLSEIKEKEKKEYPPHPLKTSTLIELSQKVLGLDPSQTMFYAQKLYEAGYITYMRTDSIRVSPEAKAQAHKFIEQVFGKEYAGNRKFKQKGEFVQDAHECIRPTNVFRDRIPFSRVLQELYSLIRTVFIASQMVPCVKKEITFIFPSRVDKKYSLRAKAEWEIFDGFKKLFSEKEKSKSEWEVLKNIQRGSIWNITKIKKCRHKTLPPERYTPATLIKKLESLGIGRPSTYPTILKILLKRNYVKINKNKIFPTELGEKVCDYLVEHFPLFMDYGFTASLEKELEEIAENKKNYIVTVSKIYSALQKEIEKLKSF